MKKRLLVAALILSMILTACSGTSHTESNAVHSDGTASSGQASGGNGLSALSDTDADQEQLEAAIQATVLCYLYQQKSGTYTPSAQDEAAYWMTLNLYTSLRADAQDGEITYSDGYRCIDEEHAKNALYVLFSDFDGNILTQAPDTMSGSYFSEGTYYFAPGDFGDDAVRVKDSSKEEDGSYDVTAEYYNASDSGQVYNTYTVHLTSVRQADSESTFEQNCAVASVTQN